jgi:hypothetical protein
MFCSGVSASAALRLPQALHLQHACGLSRRLCISNCLRFFQSAAGDRLLRLWRMNHQAQLKSRLHRRAKPAFQLDNLDDLDSAGDLLPDTPCMVNVGQTFPQFASRGSAGCGCAAATAGSSINRRIFSGLLIKAVPADKACSQT